MSIVWFIVGSLFMLTAMISHYLLFKALALLFVPGGTIVYYLRERHLVLRKNSGDVFPLLLSFMVSFFASGLNSQLLTPHGLGTTNQQLLVGGLAMAFSAGFVLLVELMLPNVLPDSWAIRPGVAMILAWGLALGTSAAGLVALVRAIGWLTGGVIVLLGGIAWGWYHRIVRPDPRFEGIVVFYGMAYFGVMATAAVVQTLR